MIGLESSGSFKNLEAMLKRVTSGVYLKAANATAQKGVDALSQATPKDSGTTASSWSCEVVKEPTTTIYWSNSNVNKGVNVALILQTGHGTGTGGYVPGRDYINPAMAPIFNSAAEEVWKEVTK